MVSSWWSVRVMFSLLSAVSWSRWWLSMRVWMMSAAFAGMGLLDRHELMVGSFTPHFSASHSFESPFSCIQGISFSFVI